MRISKRTCRRKTDRKKIVANSHLKVTHYGISARPISQHSNESAQKKTIHVIFLRSIEIYVDFFGIFFLSYLYVTLEIMQEVYAKIFCHFSHLFRVYDANKARKQTKENREKNEAIKW